jgi:hypothetical protein
MFTWRIAEAFQEFRGADADAEWVKWSDVAAVLDTEGDRPMEGFAGKQDHGFAGMPEHLQPSNLPIADTEGDRQEPNPNKTPGPLFAQTPDGDWVCEHGTASDVHCCGCHSGFLFDSRTCVCF